MQTNRTGVNEARLETARKEIADSGLPKTARARPPRVLPTEVTGRSPGLRGA